MLVRNLTQGNLILKGVVSGKRIKLPPLKVVNIDELDFPAERIKKFYGNYIHILTEKLEEKPHEEVPTEPKKDMEPEKGNGNVSTIDETVTEGEKDENTGSEDTATDANTENADNDSDDIDELVDSVLEEIEGELTGEEKVSEKEPAKKSSKATKKTGKKSSKK